MTNADALIIASEKLCETLQNAAPEAKAMETSANALTKYSRAWPKRKRQAAPGDCNARTRKLKGWQAMRPRAKPQRVGAEASDMQPQRVSKNAPGNVKQWIRLDKNAKCYFTTKKGGPSWATV